MGEGWKSILLSIVSYRLCCINNNWLPVNFTHKKTAGKGANIIAHSPAVMYPKLTIIQ
jgi:hypothetical protein